MSKVRSAYAEIEEKVLERYGERGESLVVQVEMRHGVGEAYERKTVLLLNDYDYGWMWEVDWWSGEEDVRLVGAQPVSDVKVEEW